ncbi:MAG: hypothetical protein QF444_01180 [Phycisphaerales bacterium]|jgi:hypothetical protein|nr:hypothetical protein [Phycisphaerales bacterium]MDP6692913.1 hypothetical protein [Phycisphaerales bacterium]
MVRIEQRTLDHLVETYHQRRTLQTRQLVWNELASMTTLYFVQCGSRTSSVPWVVFEKEAPIAMVFTDRDRALAAAKAIVEDDSELRVVGLPTNAASMYISALAAQGVAMVCFNHGPKRFDAPVDEVLLAMKSMKR